MAVTSVKELKGKFRAEIDDKFQRDVTRVFEVMVDDWDTSYLEIVKGDDGNNSVPEHYEQMPGDFKTTLRSKSAQPADEDQGLIWYVTCKFSSKREPDDKNEDDNNPLTRKPVIRYSFNRYQEAAEQDKDGRPILNTAGDVYNPPLQRDKSLLILDFTRNEKTFNPITALNYIDSTNSDIFLGVGPRFARCMDMSGDERKEEGITYYAVHYQFAFKVGGWERQVLNIGYRERVKVNGKFTKKDIIDPKTGKRTEIPMPLKEDGSAFPYNADPADISPHYNRYRIDKELPFGPLNIAL